LPAASLQQQQQQQQDISSRSFVTRRHKVIAPVRTHHSHSCSLLFCHHTTTAAAEAAAAEATTNLHKAPYWMSQLPAPLLSQGAVSCQHASASNGCCLAPLPVPVSYICVSICIRKSDSVSDSCTVRQNRKPRHGGAGSLPCGSVAVAGRQGCLAQSLSASTCFCCCYVSCIYA
jgi:hypothetical protein